MNATPSHEPERAEFARLLPAPAYPELSVDRQSLLKEDLMSHLSERPQPRSRKRLVLGLATPLAALGAAALVVTVSGTGSPSAPSVPSAKSARSAASAHSQGTVNITNAAYSLDLTKGDEITVTVHRNGAKVDGDKLKADLARLGVNAQVARKVPNCYPKWYTLAASSGGNDYTFTFKRSLLAKSSMMAVFPMGPPPKIKIKGNTATATGGGKGDVLTVYTGVMPTCMKPAK